MGYFVPRQFRLSPDHMEVFAGNSAPHEFDVFVWTSYDGSVFHAAHEEARESRAAALTPHGCSEIFLSFLVSILFFYSKLWL